MNRNWIIPLPPGSEASAAKGHSKQAVGFYPCINANNHCEQYILVKLDNKGRPYGTCSKQEITTKGCIREVKGLGVDAPEQSFAAYQEALKVVDALCPIPDSYKLFLEREWQVFNQREVADENISA